MTSVVSDTSGVVATKLIDGIIAGRKDLDSLIAESYHGKLKASKELLKKALEGRVTAHHKFMLKQIKGNLAHLESQVEMLDKEMDNKLEEFNEQVTLLQTIPGVGKYGAKGIIAEIGTDMNVFPDEKHLSSWAGMSPGSNESAGKKCTLTTKGNQFLKPLLTEFAWGATRTKGTYFRAKYESLVGRRGKKRALIAVGHKILCASYHIMKENVPNHELGANYLIEKKRKNRKSSLEIKADCYWWLLTPSMKLSSTQISTNKCCYEHEDENLNNLSVS